MMQELRQVLELFYRLNIGAEFSIEQLNEAFWEIITYQNDTVRDVLLGGFLTSIMVKKPSVSEIVSLLKTAFKLDSYVFENALTISLPNNKKVVGTVGSGKKGVKTINISTPSAIIAASLGGFIGKTGSHSTSSMSGSADFMQAIGMNFNSNEKMIEILKSSGFGFFSIEKIIPKFDEIYGGRFFAPHALSFGLAALVSPIKFDTILFGLAHPRVDFALKVLREFNILNAMVVSSSHDNIHYLDEIGIFGTTRLIGMKNGSIGRLRTFFPTEELGLPKYTPQHIAQGKDLFSNIKFSIDVLRGKGEKAHEDIICINTSNLLYMSNISEDIREGFLMAKAAVRKGLPFQKLEEVISLSDGNIQCLMRYC